MTALRSVGVVALGLGWFDRLPLDRIGPWLYGETDLADCCGHVRAEELRAVVERAVQR